MGQLIGLHCEPDIPGIPSWGARSSPNLIRFVHFNFAPSDAALFTSVSRFPAANLTLLSVRFVLVLFLFFFFGHRSAFSLLALRPSANYQLSFA